MCGKLRIWLHILVFMLILLRTESLLVNITYLRSAVAKGAVCLDGSPPAYHLDRGYGEGINNWLVQFEGGGWCNNVTTCFARKNTRLGSSNRMVNQLAFSGILSNRERFNPYFYNWTRVKIRYCDGGSFTGDVEAVNPRTKLHYRGARILNAVMEDLLARGMNLAENAILSGCSAGGLTTILHCDNLKKLFPRTTNVKCLSDAGFFIDTKDVSGVPYIETYFHDIVTTHGSAKHLPSQCTSQMRSSLCLFPQNVAKYIQTPLFILNAAYDSWQIKNILAPFPADPHGLWLSCKMDIANCSASQLKTMQGFRLKFLKALHQIGTSTSRGYFINSCYAHCQTEMKETWFSSDSPRLNNKTIAEAVGEWFYDKSTFQKGDCVFPCDKTCHNQVFEPYELDKW